MTSKSQTILTYADALNNANTIKQNLDKPSSERTSLDGLDSSIAAISLAATTAAEVASATNSSPSGAANAMGAMSTGIAFQLNGAAASASLAATYVYMKQGQFDKAASTSLGVVSGLAGMLQVASSTLPGVNPVEGVAGATGGSATALNLAISNPQLLKAVSEEISGFYDKNLENFRDWFLPKLGDNINKVLDPNTWKDWFNKLKDDLLPDLPSEKEWYIDDGKQCLAPWADQNRDGKYHIYDPLVLDLDGDGIETVGTSGYAGALFDHDKDGIRTSTGGVSADDGLLVVDLNGDGKVNNGGELFGDSYVLKDGNTAANGFAALAEFDSNSDGIVDANDADFAKLKIWRDLDSDGISNAGELFSLEEVNVKSLNVAHSDVNKALGNGNILAQDDSYTKADGTTSQMGDLLLAADHLHSRYADSVTLTEEQARYANLQGIGCLRDLREAAALSPELAEALQAYRAAETKAEQQVLLDTLVEKWEQTDPQWATGVRFLLPMIKTAGEGTALTRSQEKNYRQAA